MSAYPPRVHLSCYRLHVHLSCFSFIDRSLCSEYDVGCFYAYLYFFLHAKMVTHMEDTYLEFHSHMVCTCRLLYSLLTTNPLGFTITILELGNI